MSVKSYQEMFRSKINPQRVLVGYFILLLFFSAFYLFRSSIFLGDTDMWYHMSGGRQFFHDGRIPDSSYFSFIEPEKAWVNYYWLFQVLAYKVYSMADYDGLIALRALLLLGTLGLVTALLLHDERSLSRLLQGGVLAVISIAALAPRMMIIRPHMFSYLFIALFLYILECRPRWTPVLPIIGVLWANAHGVEYPVLVLICLAYIADMFVRRRRNGGTLPREDLIRALILVLAMWSVMLTPHGYQIFSSPFSTAAFTSDYIQEMRPITWDLLLDYRWLHSGFVGFTAMNLMVLLGVLALGSLLMRRRIESGAFLLLAGGLFLLTQGIRFYWEATLLCLPVLKRALAVPEPLPTYAKPPPSFARVALVAALAIFPFGYVHDLPMTEMRYPVSYSKLPHGVVAFLNYVDTGGKVVNPAATGGYFQWELYPQGYRIYMDLQMSIFSAEDLFLGAASYRSAPALKRMIETYRPDYISVPLEDKVFLQRIKEIKAPYAMVFFDDVDVLFAHREMQKAVVDRYEIPKINPFNLQGTDISALTPVERADLLRQLLLMDSMYPHITVVNQTIALIYGADKDYAKALPYAEALIKDSPDLSLGFSAKGDALLGLEKWKEARDCFQKSLEIDDAGARRTYWKIWFCYRKLGDQEAAYRAARKGLSLFSSDVSYKSLYDYGLTALDVKRFDEALMAFRFADILVPEDEKDLASKIKEALELFEENSEGETPRSSL